MGVVASLLGDAEDAIKNVVYKMLMPSKAPDWFAGGRRLSLPAAPPDSLLLIGEVALEISDIKAATEFYGQTLGACVTTKQSDEDGTEIVLVQMGASRLRLRRSGSNGDVVPAKAWPGHTYVWVRDIKATLARCQKQQEELGKEIVQHVHNIKAEDTIDALEIQDPDGNCFVVNEAPRGHEERLRKMVSSLPTEVGLLSAVEVGRAVPAGVAVLAAKFFVEFFNAAASERFVADDEAWDIHFAPGPALRQTLTFVNAESDEEDSGGGAITIYFPDDQRFEESFDRCLEASIIKGSVTREQALDAKEFSITHCVNPETNANILDLEVTVRACDHPECTLASLS